MRLSGITRYVCSAVLAVLLNVPVYSSVQEEEPLWNGREMLARASVHNPASCIVMGMCYYYGLGIEQDISKAVHWYTLGAEAGNTECMCELAKLYRFGFLVPRDTKKAISYMERAIKAGNTPALLMLGWTYLIGQGVEKDFTRAYNLFLRAARHGHADACYWVGWCCQRGVGVSVDGALALQWYGVGALRGSANCMVGLGNVNVHGKGLRRNVVAQARFWLQLAAGQGVAEAQAMLRDLELAESVTPMSLSQLSQVTAQQCWEQYLYGIYVGDTTEQQPEAWLERAVELGHPRAAAQLASERFSVLATPNENARWLPSLEKAAAAGEPSAWSVLANYYNLCLNGEEDMHKISHCVLRYAETSQCAGAMMSMADAYALGAYNKVPDIHHVAEWTRRSAAKGFRLAADVLPFVELLSRSAQQPGKN